SPSTSARRSVFSPGPIAVSRTSTSAPRAPRSAARSAARRRPAAAVNPARTRGRPICAALPIPSTTPRTSRWRKESSSGERPPGSVSAVAGWSVVTQGFDQLVLLHVRVAGQPEFLGAALQVVDGPVVVGAGLTALLSHLRLAFVGGGIGDAGGLLLRRAVLTQLLVHLLVLDRRIRLSWLMYSA